jgi:hypothetical protein
LLDPSCSLGPLRNLSQVASPIAAMIATKMPNCTALTLATDGSIFSLPLPAGLAHCRRARKPRLVSY